MNNKNKIAEFELSFNFKNVLYIAQVTGWESDGSHYYDIEYFSPNEKGKIRLLKSLSNNTWEEPGNKHDKNFADEIASQIDTKNFH